MASTAHHRGAHDGPRRGELLALVWGDIDFKRGSILIRAENAKDGEARQLPILPRLRSMLKRIQHDPTGKPHARTAYGFGGRIGGRVGDPKKSWQACCRAAGIQGLHFHVSRAGRFGTAVLLGPAVARCCTGG